MKEQPVLLARIKTQVIFDEGGFILSQNAQVH